MRYALTCLAVLFAIAVPIPDHAFAEGEPTRLTLTPAAAPSPALKYVLLPELRDQTPGNAALEYYRAFSPEWWGNIRQPKMWEKITSALQTPLKDLSRKDLAWLETNPMLRQVERASRREHIDWGMAERLRREGYGLLLPDVQSMRQVGTLLAVRARLEIAEGRYDKAVSTLQTGLALARHVGDGVTLIQDLVGVAIAQMILAQLEELIQQLGAPNLYWALTELPRPFVDLRKGLQGEKLGMYASIPELRSLETTRLTEEQQRKLLQLLGGVEDALFGQGPETAGQKPNWNHRLVGTLLVLRAYPEAKQALIAQGRKPEEVEALPTLQVVLIHSLHQYRRLQDDLFKWYGFPYWQAQPHLEQVDKQIRMARNRLEGIPFIDLLPAIQKVVAAAVRTDRRIAALRCIEAARLYAAAHDGKLPAAMLHRYTQEYEYAAAPEVKRPATRDAISKVPLPIDPMTGKAFIYRVTGESAMLIAPPPPREMAHAGNSLYYELTIRRKK
ncbi:MAG TPA: hypothetical protein VMG10_06600 [Gemmataceae bacterium]|nr:hypothetical protein [Gemmataceae bacterium]